MTKSRLVVWSQFLLCILCDHWPGRLGPRDIYALIIWECSAGSRSHTSSPDYHACVQRVKLSLMKYCHTPISPVHLCLPHSPTPRGGGWHRMPWWHHPRHSIPREFSITHPAAHKTKSNFSSHSMLCLSVCWQIKCCSILLVHAWRCHNLKMMFI